jgi:hypothetical protein
MNKSDLIATLAAKENLTEKLTTPVLLGIGTLQINV